MVRPTLSEQLQAHVSMFLACAFWGLMAPLGKDAMTHGLDGIDMVTFRVSGAAVLFWISSIFVRHEHVPRKDIVGFFFASLFGLVLNQCCYTYGLSLTSPINASIVTTSMPVFAMVLSALILHEPITSRKILGVGMGMCGAIILILTSASALNDKVGDIRGDLLCLFAQFSFALYLSLFNPLIRRFSVFTVNKWMFLFASITLLPFTSSHVLATNWASVPVKTWLETLYVVLFGTFIGYILTMKGQKLLRPTVVSVYNYVQPLVSVTVSVLAGIGIFTWSQALSAILVCVGVRLVNMHKK